MKRTVRLWLHGCGSAAQGRSIPMADAAAFEDEPGLKLPEDLEPLLGDGLILPSAVATSRRSDVSGPEDITQLDIGLKLTTDPTKGADLAKRLVDLAAEARLLPQCDTDRRRRCDRHQRGDSRSVHRARASSATPIVSRRPSRTPVRSQRSTSTSTRSSKRCWPPTRRRTSRTFSTSWSRCQRLPCRAPSTTSSSRRR